jgi:hypothetical protein
MLDIFQFHHPAREEFERPALPPIGAAPHSISPDSGSERFSCLPSFLLDGDDDGDS